MHVDDKLLKVVAIPIVVAKLVQCLTLSTLQLCTLLISLMPLSRGKSQTVVK